MKKKAAQKESSHALDFQKILDAMRPFARFEEGGWHGSIWEDDAHRHRPVMVRFKDGKETSVVICRRDFERLLDAYRMAGGK